MDVRIAPDAPAGMAMDPDRRKTEAPIPMRAAHTPNFPALLRRIGASLLVTTYQAGKLVMVRDEGDHLNTHFRAFQAPMGMALAGDRLAVGAKLQVWEFVDVPAVAAKLDPPSRHDACFLPRSSHVTGNIQIHEMAWGVGGELWVVNTRFSCLCTLDGSASFTPRWRPPYVSALEPTDRCHLNGLGMVDGRPRYVTALGETDEPAGWRANKARGGILIDVVSGDVITRGLSMPHSPRWYAGRLWVCNSGAGTIGSININSGKYEPIAEAPGFTRGLDFAGNLAFVGLSQVRESAVFSGIPITERLTEEERTCGVCVIDLTTGQAVALLRFETAVQEVFAVTVLPGRRYPDLINDDETLLENSFVVPSAALADVPASLRTPADPIPGAAGAAGNGRVPRNPL
ncbi:TIGR03032 family protein [Isosphaeraceae bacterium EP7]